MTQVLLSICPHQLQIPMDHSILTHPQGYLSSQTRHSPAERLVHQFLLLPAVKEGLYLPLAVRQGLRLPLAVKEGLCLPLVVREGLCLPLVVKEGLCLPLVVKEGLRLPPAVKEDLL